jgi:hypothetical protein
MKRLAVLNSCTSICRLFYDRCFVGPVTSATSHRYEPTHTDRPLGWVLIQCQYRSRRMHLCYDIVTRSFARHCTVRILLLCCFLYEGRCTKTSHVQHCILPYCKTVFVRNSRTAISRWLSDGSADTSCHAWANRLPARRSKDKLDSLYYCCCNHHHHHRTGWRNGNAPDLHSRVVQFESRPGH